MGAKSTFSRLANRFKLAESGVAAVEFALILPIMLMLYIGMVEGGTLISMDRKVQTVSGAVGDLVARSDGEISAISVNDYVKVASGIMTPYATDKMVQIVSQIYVKNDGTATVDWSRRYLGQQIQGSGAHTKGSAYTVPPEIVAITKGQNAGGQYVIVTECALSYTPFYGIVFDKAVQLHRENFFLPRFREQIELVN